MFDLKKLLKSGPLLLDGATGTCLQQAGMPTGVCPELWILDHKEIMQNVTRVYMEAGSRIVYAPTFSANSIKLEEYHAAERLEEINTTLVKWTREAVDRDAYGDDAPCYVAGDLTMTGQSLAPTGMLEFEELVDCYKEQVRAIASAGVDLIVIETMMNLGESRAAVLAVKEETDLPVFVTMTFEKNGRTLYGTDAVTALVTLQALGVDAFGINCSCGPDLMVPWIQEMKKYAKVPLIVKPNAGLPKFVDGKTVFDMDKEPFTEAALRLIEEGAAIVGGCCGTSPEYIRMLSDTVKNNYADTEKWQLLYEKVFAMPADKYARVLTSERQFVRLDLDGQFTVIGERINPTGKKALQAELLHGSVDMVLDMAEDQADQGAAILDINVGMGGIDEKATMLEVIEEVSEIVHTPLCIDSSNVEVIEAALRKYHGRALVNSVSCESEKMARLLPIVEKYGAMFILLPMTGAGLPKDVEERKANINTVLAAAAELGMSKMDVVVDGLTCAIGASVSAGADTLDTIAYARNLGLATVCGLSNISFGLPERSYVNSMFLALAISRGLMMAIANPAQNALMRAGYVADLLMGKESANIRYIEACEKYRGEEAPKTIKIQPKEKKQNVQAVTAKQVSMTEKAASVPVEKKSQSEGIKLPQGLEVVYEDVLKGKAKGIGAHVEDALSGGTPADQILNEALIPAINTVGEYFSQQKYFLPQLMISAEAMRRGVDILEPELMKKNEGLQGPTVVIATVKGDVHDIGKNLVSMMMKNYGFNVIDLGKDVDKETIIRAAKENHAQVIALSALMTTTMQYMKDIIYYAAEQNVGAKIIVGGAALTADYAEKIGADGYSEDAVGAVRLVQRLLDL